MRIWYIIQRHEETMNRPTPDPSATHAWPAEFAVLRHFRMTHPLKHAVVNGVEWEYIASGQGQEALLILPALMGIAEMAFQHIMALENEYHVIAPSYPAAITTVAALTEGIAGVLDAEGVWQTHVLGGSYGGMMAQAFVRRYPQRVRTLILSHTGGPRPERAAKNRTFMRVLRLLPTSLMRSLLWSLTRKSLQGAPEQRAFWEAYSNEIIARLKKPDLISRYEVAIDFDANAAHTDDALEDWPGRVLILEGDDDPIAEAPEREALKAEFPQAQVHTFHGSGHVASLAKTDEYVGVIKRFLMAPP
jgi:pimeloyl-ACP methyl ester carboxylesterase